MTRTKEFAPVKTMAIKGFDKDLKCRDFQFEIGKTYKHKGKVETCQSGFHAVSSHPLSVFNYYAPAGSRFCFVELDGVQKSENDKTAAEILTVGRELGLTDLVNETVRWVVERSTPEGEAATCDQGAASATGTRGAASATGDQGAAMASGFGGRVMGSKGNALFACERETWAGPIVSVACGVVGQGGIKAGVWYACRGGKLVEVV